MSPIRATAAIPGDTSLSAYDAVIVRTMPPGSLEQVVFRMDVLHRIEASGRCVLTRTCTVQRLVTWPWLQSAVSVGYWAMRRALRWQGTSGW